MFLGIGNLACDGTDAIDLLGSTDESGLTSTGGTGPTAPETSDTDTPAVDPDAISSSDPLFDVFSSSVLKALPAETDADFNSSIDTYLTNASTALTGADHNDFGNHPVTIFGDFATTYNEMGQAVDIAYLSLAGGFENVVVPAADLDSLVRGAEFSSDSGVDVPHITVGVVVVRDSDTDAIASASIFISPYGAVPDANALRTLLFPDVEQTVTVIDNFGQSSTVYTDPAGLGGAETAAVDLLGAMTSILGTDGDAPLVDHITIPDDIF